MFSTPSEIASNLDKIWVTSYILHYNNGSEALFYEQFAADQKNLGG